MLKTIKKNLNKIPVHFFALAIGFAIPIFFLFIFSFFLSLNLKGSLIASVQSAFSKNDNSSQNYTESGSLFESLLKPASLPILRTDVETPAISAKSAIIMDFNTGRILFEKDSSQKLQIGSLTKLASTVIALENLDLKNVITLTADDISFKGSLLRFYAGEQYSIESLLKFALIESNNNAIYAIASSLGIELFVKKMNEFAQRLGMINTSFQNPIGLDNEENYSTADDIAILLNNISRYPLIKDILTQKSIEIRSKNNRKILISNINRLIDDPDVIFGKTGTTQKALQNYAALIRAPDNRELVLVILNSQNRYKDAQNLISWLKEGFVWQ